MLENGIIELLVTIDLPVSAARLQQRRIHKNHDFSKARFGKLPQCTLPETNSSSPKMDSWKIDFLLGPGIFRCYANFREGIKISHLPQVISVQTWLLCNNCWKLPTGAMHLKSFRMIVVCIYLTIAPKRIHTVDGRNPAPVDMENIPLLIVLYIPGGDRRISEPSTVPLPLWKFHPSF